MASRFWVGGTGNWDAATTTHWASTSGGAGGASVPTNVDAVTFDSNSGASAVVTITAPASAASIAIGTTFTGTLLCSSTLNVLGAMTHSGGTLNTNGQTMVWGSFAGNTAGARTLTLGASSITVTSTGTCWTLRFSNLTMTANTATITCSGTATTCQISATTGGNYNGTSFAFTGSGTCLVVTSGSGTTTIANLTRTGTAIATDGVSFQNNLTATGTLAINGNSTINRLLVSAGTATSKVDTGTPITLTANGTLSISNADFQDIIGAGSASWNLASITGGSGDCGGNTAITFTTAATQTFAGGTKNWSDVTAWSSRVPLPQDDVAIATSGTITPDMPRMGRTIDFTGCTGTFATASGTSVCTFYGSLIFGSGMTVSGSGVVSYVASGRGSFVLDLAGKTLTLGSSSRQFQVLAPGGTYTLAADAAITQGSVANGFQLVVGTLDFNGHALKVSHFQVPASNLTSVSRTVTPNGGHLDLLGTDSATVLNVTATGLTFTTAFDVNVTGATASTRTFAGGGMTYGTLDYTVVGSTGALTITGSNTFSDIRFSDASNVRTLGLTAGTTQTITATHGLTGVVGTSGTLMTLKSATAGTPASISLPNGYGGSTDFLSVQDITALVNTLYAGTNSANVSGNTNVTFTAAPGGSTVFGTASGASTSAGAATGTRIVLATASGASTSTGVASGTPTVVGVGSGSSLSSGAEAGTPTVVGLASGAAPSSGIALGQRFTFSTADGHSASAGSVLGARIALGLTLGASTSTGAATGVGTSPAAGLGSGASISAGAATAVVTVTGAASGASTSAASSTGKRSTFSIALGASTSGASAAGVASAFGMGFGSSGSSANADGRVTVSGVAHGATLSGGQSVGSAVHLGTALGASTSNGHALQAGPLETVIVLASTYDLDARATYVLDGRRAYRPDNRTTHLVP